MSRWVSLSGLDSAFLSLETPNTPMHIMGTLVVDASSDSDDDFFEEVVRVVEERVPDLAPFRRRLAMIPFGLDHPVWIEDREFRVRNHIARVRAPAPGSEPVLARLVAEMAAHPLDRTRPLWELQVIEGLAEGRLALVFKVHHAVADGVSAMQLLLELLDPSPVGTTAGPSGAKVRGGPAPTNQALLGHALSRLPRRSVRLAQLLLDSASSVAGAARSLKDPVDESRMPMPFSAPETPWNGATSSRRTVAYGRAPLSDIKLINSVFDTTVNHVVLAACTQTLRNYLAAQGGVPDTPLVAAVPVSLRTPEELGTYGNRISALLVHLPVHLADPLEQLLTLKHDAGAAKQLHTRLGVSALGEWAEFLSSALLGFAARLYSDWKLAARHRPLHNLVISNVRGPGTPLYAAGARVTAAYPHGPLMEGAGINITIVSYRGSVDFGVIACGHSVRCADDIALGFGTAVAELHKLALANDERTSVPAPGGRTARDADPAWPARS